MTRLTLRIAIVSALVGAAVFAIFFGRASSPATAGPVAKGTTCTGCGLFELLPVSIAVAKAPIPRGRSALALDSRSLRWKNIPRSKFVEGMLVEPRELRGEITIRTIPAGAILHAADFGLRSPIYYPRGYPKSIPASQIPAKITNSHYLPDFPSDLEVAPGVWVDGSPSEAALDEHVANGTLVGYCRSIRSFRAHNPDVPFATKCWRK